MAQRGKLLGQGQGRPRGAGRPRSGPRQWAALTRRSCSWPLPLSASGGWWGLGLLSGVECEMLQRGAIVLQCFVLPYKKEEINTHFLHHALGSTRPPRPPFHPAGEGAALQQNRLTSFQGQKCKPLILHLAVKLLKTSPVTGGRQGPLTSLSGW